MSKTLEEMVAEVGHPPTREELAKAMKEAHAKKDLPVLARLRTIYDRTK